MIILTAHCCLLIYFSDHIDDTKHVLRDHKTECDKLSLQIIYFIKHIFILCSIMNLIFCLEVAFGGLRP